MGMMVAMPLQGKPLAPTAASAPLGVQPVALWPPGPPAMPSAQAVVGTRSQTQTLI